MANPYSFIATARADVLHHPIAPDNYLPTSLRQHEQKLLWTRPGYATYGLTPTNNAIQYSSCAVYCYKLEQNVTLPPNLERISLESNPPEFKKAYIAQYRNAAATIDHYHKSNMANDQAFAQAVSNWKQTCNELTENPFFNEGWELPAFFPFYDNACTSAILEFFKEQRENDRNNLALWTKRQKHADEMYNAWKEFYLFVSSPNFLPFPKCLWYHKHFIIHERKEKNLWESYFHNSNFSTWGKTE